MAQQIPDTPEMQPLTRTQVLIAMGVTAVVLLVVSKIWLHFSQLSMLPVRFSVQAWLEGLALGVGISIASAIVYRIWGEYRRSADQYLTMVIKPLLVPDLLWLGLLPGLSEELLFRGVMLPEFGLDELGVLLSSLCFGVLHMSNLKQWSYVVWASLVGIALGLSAVWTGNLLVPIVAHILTNLVSGATWKLSNRD
ncbi:CPBP family intramembrane glutamic endopeptidase [Leptolyngbya sp. GGD]|uniref:CPBP family intramembrane glutamic endopeptidase n=1 Tax=Leptolyngbya sp. GGD TaxID=2997907 RepID=UPI00227D2BDC|nr:CPBP family intramembrane glutamic endopeptidase [Leptolyngbya sp. GGD]MCY6491336.1 CPBP family intramembrane metalloprotease [Leptolyngbya sp. GGD]